MSPMNIQQMADFDQEARMVTLMVVSFAVSSASVQLAERRDFTLIGDPGHYSQVFMIKLHIHST